MAEAQVRLVERERRWLCHAFPRDRILRSEAIVDLYVSGTRLRLREAAPLDGGPVMRRLGRKADVDPRTRLLTSIYLDETEFDLLAALPGERLRKVRHHLRVNDGVALSVDEFEGPLAGLILAEAEFETTEELEAYPDPDFSIREVTADDRYTGGRLVRDGRPLEP